MIYLCGAPPHQDMYDLKPDAPDEVRGEFKPIQTKVTGIQICELFPRIARQAPTLDGHSVVKEEQMPDGRRKVILSDPESGRISERVVD